MDVEEFSILSEFDPGVASRPELEGAVGAFAALRSFAAAGELACLAAIDALDDNGVPADAIARVKTKCSSVAAKRAASTAMRLAEMPATSSALRRGEITVEHANAAADAAERVSPEEADAQLGPDAGKRPADLFARHAREWASARESDEQKQDRYDRQVRARRGWVKDRPGGTVGVYAEFDPIEGAHIKKAFAAETDRLWRADGGREGRPDEVRTFDQRGADALANLILGRTPVGATAGPGKRPHPRYQVGVRVDAGRLRAADPDGMAELTDGTPLPRSVLERIACEAEFVGQIFDTDGSILWQGRAERLATDAQWTALIARDGGCFCCGADPSRCEAHHLQPWAPPTRGSTDIDTMVLVCHRTHHLIHDHGYTARWENGRWVLRPPRASGRDPGGDRELRPTGYRNEEALVA